VNGWSEIGRWQEHIGSVLCPATNYARFMKLLKNIQHVIYELPFFTNLFMRLNRLQVQYADSVHLDSFITLAKRLQTMNFRTCVCQTICMCLPNRSFELRWHYTSARYTKNKVHEWSPTSPCNLCEVTRNISTLFTTKYACKCHALES